MPPRLPRELPHAVVVYETRSCGFCMMAKSLLRSRGVDFATVDVSGDAEARQWLISETGQRTVPQIFIHGQSIGGFQELAALDRQGALAERLANPPPTPED